MVPDWHDYLSGNRSNRRLLASSLRIRAHRVAGEATSGRLGSCRALLIASQARQMTCTGRPELAPRRAVQQGFLTRVVSQIEPVLHKVHPQHPLQSYRGATLACLRVVRLDHGAQRRLRHDLLHHRQEYIPPRRAAIVPVVACVRLWVDSILIRQRPRRCNTNPGRAAVRPPALWRRRPRLGCWRRGVACPPDAAPEPTRWAP